MSKSKSINLENAKKIQNGLEVAKQAMKFRIVARNVNKASKKWADANAAMSKAEAKAAADKAAKEAASNLSNKRFQQTQAQVDEVVDIMRMNVDKVLERDQKLSQLDDRADALQMGASQFEQSAGSLKRKMAWQNMKMMILMGVVGTIMGAVVIFWIYTKVNPEGAAELNPLAPRPPAVEQAPPAPAASPASRR